MVINSKSEVEACGAGNARRISILPWSPWVLLISTFVVKNQPCIYARSQSAVTEKEQVVAIDYHHNMREAIPTASWTRCVKIRLPAISIFKKPAGTCLHNVKRRDIKDFSRWR